jgi:hypothetical protein
MDNQFDELGNVTHTVDFAYDEIDRRVFDVELDEDEYHKAAECLHRIMAWIYQNGGRPPEGFACRCILACWAFLPELHGESITSIANAHGKHKQSLGRAVDDFKRDFPEVAKRLPHLKHE